jgi:hypothetical protein
VALKHFHASGSKYLLTYDLPATEENTDIVSGWWRPINHAEHLPRHVTWVVEET